MNIENEEFLKALKIIIDSSEHNALDDEVTPQASLIEGIDLSETPEEKNEREIEAWLKDIE